MNYNEVICLYLKKYLTDEQFKEYFYYHLDEFENDLDEDIYLEMISTNFNSREQKFDLREYLQEYIFDNCKETYENINDAYIERYIQSDNRGIIREILKSSF